MSRYITLLTVLLTGCATPVKKEPKPDQLIHEDKGPVFWYQVWEKEDGSKYIKELYRGTITYW